MNSTRLDMLRRFAEEDPHDAFNWYALALEHLKSDPAQALVLFEKLLEEFSEYLPTYYMAASQYAYVGNLGKAIQILEKGIALARKQDDHKTTGELQSALDEITFE